MLITVERVAVLRRAPLFAGTPGRALAGLAQALDEVEVLAGETVMREGATEDWLFVVAHGELEVQRADRRAVLHAGDVVGELAVLDPEPRSATVVALTDALLLRLGKADFDEVLASRPEVARAVIHELVRRLREHHDGGGA